MAGSCHPTHGSLANLHPTGSAQAPLPRGSNKRRRLVQMLSFPSVPTGPELSEFQQVWGALSCQMLAALLNC